MVAEPDRAWVDETPDRDDEADWAPAELPSAVPVLHLARPTYRIATVLDPDAIASILAAMGHFTRPTAGLTRSASHLRITVSPNSEALFPPPAADMRGLHRP